MVTPEERARTDEKLKDPAMPPDVVAYVACGNSLIDLCNIWQVTYWRVSQFMYANHKDEYESAISTRGEWMIQRVIDEIKSIGLVDIRLAYDDNGHLKDPKDWPDNLARCVSAVETLEEYEDIGQGRELMGYTKKLKLWDKLKALELLGRNLKIFTDDKNPRPLIVQVFQGLDQPKLLALPVEERINLIESALRSQ